MNYRRYLLIITVIAALASLTGGAWWYWYNDFGNLETYRNDQFGFEFKYPSGLRLYETGTETRGPIIPLFGLYLTNGKPLKPQTSGVTLQMMKTNMIDLNDYASYYKNTELINKVIIFSKSYINLAGNKALIEKTYNKLSPNNPNNLVYLINDKRAFIWFFGTSTNTPESTANMRQIENQILSSFHFTK